MVKILVGLLLLPILPWAISFLPFPDTLPSGMTTSVETLFLWIGAVNQILPLDTLFSLFMILLTVHFGEVIWNVVKTMIHVVKQ